MLGLVSTWVGYHKGILSAVGFCHKPFLSSLSFCLTLLLPPLPSQELPSLAKSHPLQISPKHPREETVKAAATWRQMTGANVSGTDDDC